MTPRRDPARPPKPVAGAEIQPEPLHPPADGAALKPGPLDADIVWLFDLASGPASGRTTARTVRFLIHGNYLYLNTATGVDNTHKRIRAPGCAESGRARQKDRAPCGARRRTYRSGYFFTAPGRRHRWGW